MQLARIDIRSQMIVLTKIGRVAAFLVFVECGLLARAAGAETFWVHPDRDPFRGTLESALDLFEARGIPRKILDEQWRMYASGHCTRRRIGDGERIDLMTFGRNRVLPAVIAEPSLWPDWMPRDVTICRIVVARGSEYALLRPDVCGNWSEERLPPRPVPTSPAAAREMRPLPTAPSEIARISGAVPGSGAFLQPAEFVAPTILPGSLPEDFAPAMAAGPILILPDSSGPPGSSNLSPVSPPINVPEPDAGLLFGSALAVLALLMRACRRQKPAFAGRARRARETGEIGGGGDQARSLAGFRVAASALARARFRSERR
jgi:hypothetical protein